MPVADNDYKKMAEAAEQRVARAHAAGEQLTFLADELPAGRDPDAPKRGPGKALSQMREFLATKGYRQPEEVLVQLAGLDSGETVLAGAMREAEEILLWAADGAAEAGKVGSKHKVAPTLEQRKATLEQCLARRMRAAEAVLPYGLAKVSGDVNVVIPTQIVMPGAVALAPAAAARDITPVSDRRMAPPPMPNEMQQNQALNKNNPDDPDAETRTE